MRKRFQIGDLAFSLQYPEEVTPPDNFLKFEAPGGETAFHYQMSLVDELPEPEGALIAQRPDIRVYRTALGEERLLGVRGQADFYACYRETGRAQADIFLVEGRIASLHIDPVFTSLFALERRMLERDSLILHCAYVRYRDGAILFSAPSETGKTTQANLWEQHRGSRTVNGDRALLRRMDGVWTAEGWPVCGTSAVCHNERTPIHAVVMLRQARENVVRRLRPSEAFLQLYAQITVNGWSRDSVEKSTELLSGLITDIPVYELGCTVSEEAVDCLERALYG
ncbi:MAG: hypothetical protein LUC39_07640 [Clostridiales bacterium]|nr:hypothetical protein [Clostridiales bacterium]